MQNCEKTAIERMEAEPVFELEEFMNFARETRISRQTLETLINFWQNWQNKIAAMQITSGGKSWLAIWLPEEIEREVDKAWEASPSEGFLINSLAQYMCMAAVEQMLPEAAGGGCAPAPEPALALTDALAQLGLLKLNERGKATLGDTALIRRYAILTYYPFRGGCEICAMRKDCPKANGAGDFANVVLPGHERGND